jgi:hypothetical protein
MKSSTLRGQDENSFEPMALQKRHLSVPLTDCRHRNDLSSGRRQYSLQEVQAAQLRPL